MKKIVFILLTLLVLLPTFFAFAKKNASVTEHTTEHTTSVAQTLDADADAFAEADTIGGSTGGAPVGDLDEMMVFASVEEMNAVFGETD